MSDAVPSEEDLSESETFRITQGDKAALLALMRLHFPRLKNRSDVLRAVFRLGLVHLAEDPGKLHTADTPRPEDLTVEAIRARKDRQRAARVEDEPEEEDSKAPGRAEEVREAIDESKTERAIKKRGKSSPSS